jgi:hypothetical protein
MAAQDYEQLSYGAPDGCMIGKSATEKVGFFGATPVVQQATVAAATDATTVITTANACRTALRNLGLMA